MNQDIPLKSTGVVCEGRQEGGRRRERGGRREEEGERRRERGGGRDEEGGRRREGGGGREKEGRRRKEEEEEEKGGVSKHLPQPALHQKQNETFHKLPAPPILLTLVSNPDLPPKRRVEGGSGFEVNLCTVNKFF